MFIYVKDLADNQIILNMDHVLVIGPDKLIGQSVVHALNGAVIQIKETIGSIKEKIEEANTQPKSLSL